jgi:hypothetical protein
MSWRGFLCAATAAAFMQGCTDLADGGRGRGPWDGGGYRESPYPEGGYGGYGGYDEDERVWESEHRRYSCDQVEGRIRYDRDKIASIDPTKHHKALQWYKDDLQNAERDRYECRDYFRERHEQSDWERRENLREQQAQQERQREQCAKIQQRIAYDRQQVATIDPSKHHKALQWFKDDLRNAERDLASCHR